MTQDLIDHLTLPVGLIGLFFWGRFCIALLRAHREGEAG